MAAALRLLSRREAAAAATLAPLMRPLIPASTTLYSKPPYPLHTMGAAGGLQDLRRAQLCSSPVPSLLRLYSSKGFASPVLQQPTEQQATCRLKKLPSPIRGNATAAALLPGSRGMQLSVLPVPSLIRHLSSTGNALPPLRQPIVRPSTRYLKVLGLALFLLMISNWIGIWWLYVGEKHIQRHSNMAWFLDRASNDLKEQSGLMHEAFETFQKAAHHLLEKGLDDQVSAMFDQGVGDYLKASYVIEKVIDDIIEVTGSCDEFPLDTRENIMLLLKELKNSINDSRQEMMKTADYFETLKKSSKWGWQSPVEPRGIEEV